MRYIVSIFDPLDEDFPEDRDEEGETYTLKGANEFAQSITALNPRCIASIYQEGNYSNWYGESVGAEYHDACLKAQGR